MTRQSLFALAALAGTLAAASSAAEAQIRIAVAGPMTGQYAEFGAEMKLGAQQAVADINASGGVLGKQVVLEVSDDTCDPRHAPAAAENLVFRGVVFVAGHFCSASSIRAGKVYAEAGVLQISPASVNPRFTEEGGWNTFRVVGRDDRQGRVAAEHILAHHRGRRVAVLHDGTAYGRGLAAEVRAGLRAGGMAEALAEPYRPGERDHSALVSRLQQEGIEVVYLGGYAIEAGLIVRQMRARGLEAVAIGGDALATEDFRHIAGAAAEGTLVTVPRDPRARPEAAEVVARLRARTIEPGRYVLQTYAAIGLWADAARRAGTTDPRRLAQTLKAGGPWPSLLGLIRFDDKGDLADPDHVLRIWRNGALVEP